MDSSKTVAQVYQFFNQRDLDSALAHVTETAEIINIATGQKFTGKSGVRQYLTGWIQAFPDAQVTLSRIGGSDDCVAAEFVGKGTHQGPLSGPQGGTLPPTGRKIEVRFCEVWSLKDGKMDAGRLYYDGATMMAQLGITALPAVKEGKAAEQRPH